MDSVSVPSRFSCLKIDDEETYPSSTKKKNETNINGKLQTKKTSLTDKTNGTKKPNNKQGSLHNLNSSKSSMRKLKFKSKAEAKQWEEWKKKDEEFLDEHFQQDLKCAILQSKLDYENQKKNSEIKTVNVQDKTTKKKYKTMSWDQFLESTNHGKDVENKAKEDVSDFFENALKSAKQEIKKEKLEEKRRQRNTNIEEVITLVQYEEKLKQQIEINDQLKKELDEAKNEIALVKNRNKMLCGMLSQGEMKDKATVLLELERLRTVKEELGEEVVRLHKLLEQERSFTKANLNNNSESHIFKHKEKNKK